MDLSKIEGLNEDQQKAIAEMLDSEVAGLKENRDLLKKEKDDLKAKYGEIEGQLDELRDFKEEIEEKQEAGDNNNKLALERAQKRAEKREAKLSAERDKYKADLEKLVLDKGISDGLDQIGVAPTMKKYLEASFRSQATIEEGKGYIGGAEILEALEEWRKTDDAKGFIPFQNSGGGANGARSDGQEVDNPWNPETRNLTKQAILKKRDPKLARELAAQHGVSW